MWHMCLLLNVAHLSQSKESPLYDNSQFIDTIISDSVCSDFYSKSCACHAKYNKVEDSFFFLATKFAATYQQLITRKNFS